MPDKAIHPKEVSERLGVHLYTVYLLLRKGTLRGFKINRYWRVLEEDLGQFMRGKRWDEVPAKKMKGRREP